MAIKMRYLHKAKNPKIVALGERFVQQYDLKDNKNAFDIIPPAYSCDKERLVILALSLKKDLDDVVRRFCAELDKKKTANVALVIDGTPEAAAKLIAVLKEAGTNVVEDVFYVSSAGFLNLKGITPEEVAKFLDENDSWVIDGTYSKCHAERRMAEAELIIFMSFGRIECLKRAIKRYKRYKGRSRPSMTVGCNERINGSFLWWLLFKGRSRKNRAKYKAMISGNEDKTIIVKNQRQLNALYEALGL